MTKITRVELHSFAFEVENLAMMESHGFAVNNIGYVPGAKMPISRYAVVINTDDGAEGEYVTHWVGNKANYAQTVLLASSLIGRDLSMREQLWDSLKRDLRGNDHMGHGPLDIALWDLVGKRAGMSISEMLGRYRTRLPVYASTYHGDRFDSLGSPEAYADFAEQCYEMGFRAFKIHGWHDGDPREEVRNVLTVAKRVGDRMTLMLDPACALETYADALYVGRACDEAGFFWYEDPYRDAGTSAFAHKRLREQLKTPILQTEHIRGIEPKVDFLLQGGTDFLRGEDFHNYREYLTTDAAKRSRFNALLHEEGVRVTARGTWFVSTAHSDADIDETLQAADRAFRKLKQS
jgi:L-alanine-DL-glutamate epimerase-like enolase superfamily enzyme